MILRAWSWSWLLVLAPALFACGGSAPAPAASATPSAAPTAARDAPLSGPDLEKLVGQWMRTDAEYVIWIEGVSPDGKLSARYLNPQPIQVSRAEVKREDGRLRLLVELRDRNYPGNFYSLTYDPRGDALYGRYNHLGLQQVFDVSFYRLGGGQAKPDAGR